VAAATLVVEAGTGCGRPRRLLTAIGVLGLASGVLTLGAALARAQPATTTSGYVTQAPNNPLWLALATPDGRWAIRLADDCTAIAAGMNVTVVGAAGDPDMRLVAAGGDSCGPAAQVPMGTSPCAQDSPGRCDVRLN
jgi:hypothetical protein